jgi:hypothetical protein
MPVSQFSTTRLSDKTTANTANTYLPQAVHWLRSNTALSRLSDLEVYEAIALAVSSGNFTISYQTHAIP